MSLKDLVKTGTRITPRRLMVYGEGGLGKSTFASQFKNPIFIATEDGLDNINTSKTDVIQTFDEVIDVLNMLYSEEHEFKTIVIDSIDWLEPMIWRCVADDHKKANIEDIGYAKGYIYALTYWTKIVKALDVLKIEKGMNSILIAHSKIEKFNDPTNEDYDRFSPDLHKKATALLVEWCDDVLFFNSKSYVSTKEGEKTRATGAGERVIFTESRPAFQAKNRLGLKSAMDWDINDNPYLKFLNELASK